MKNTFKTLLAAVAIFVGSTFTAKAQTSIAHVASQEIVEAMPEFKSAKDEVGKLTKMYESEVQTMMKELQTTMERYQAEVATKTQEENAAREKEVLGTQKSINDYRTNAVQELQKKEITLMKPIIEKARTAIQKVARANNIQYVLDSTTGAGLILADGKDLTPLVKKDLGI